jgi:hypothetical protein
MKVKQKQKYFFLSGGQLTAVNQEQPGLTVRAGAGCVAWKPIHGTRLPGCHWPDKGGGHDPGFC